MSPRKQPSSGSSPTNSPAAAPKKARAEASGADTTGTAEADMEGASGGSAAIEDAPLATTTGTPGTESADAGIEPVFSHSNAGQSVIIYWHGRQVKTVGGAVGASLRRKLAEADDVTAQGLLARASGNFKRGNERRH